MITQAVHQLDELTYDVCFWVDQRLHQWLNDCAFEFSMETYGAPPHCWLLKFKDYGASALFKLTFL